MKNLLIHSLIGIGSFAAGIAVAIFMTTKLVAALEEDREMDAFDPYFMPEGEISLALVAIERIEDGDTDNLIKYYCSIIRSNLELLNVARFEEQKQQQIRDLSERAIEKVDELNQRGLCSP